MISLGNESDQRGREKKRVETVKQELIGVTDDAKMSIFFKEKKKKKERKPPELDRPKQ